MSADCDDELIEAVRAVDPRLSSEQAAALIEAAKPLWDELGRLAWADAYGGMEFQRVFPEALAFIKKRANLGPSET
jgi:hypothetical protein